MIQNILYFNLAVQFNLVRRKKRGHDCQGLMGLLHAISILISCFLVYPPVIKHGNGKWTMYSRFSIQASIHREFCIAIHVWLPEGTSTWLRSLFFHILNFGGKFPTNPQQVLETASKLNTKYDYHHSEFMQAKNIDKWLVDRANSCFFLDVHCT